MSSAANLRSAFSIKSTGCPKLSYIASFRLVSGIPVLEPVQAVELPVRGTGTVGGTGVAVQRPVGAAPPGLVVGGALTSEERQTGIAIASKLKNVLKDESRPVMLPGRREPIYPYNHDIDCQFVLDSSGSIGYREFIKAKKATKVSQYYNR